LDWQIARLLEFANTNGLSVNNAVTEVGYGQNGHRQKLMKLLSIPKFGTS